MVGLTKQKKNFLAKLDIFYVIFIFFKDRILIFYHNRMHLKKHKCKRLKLRWKKESMLDFTRYTYL